MEMNQLDGFYKRYNTLLDVAQLAWQSEHIISATSIFREAYYFVRLIFRMVMTLTLYAMVVYFWFKAMNDSLGGLVEQVVGDLSELEQGSPVPNSVHSIGDGFTLLTGLGLAVVVVKALQATYGYLQLHANVSGSLVRRTVLQLATILAFIFSVSAFLAIYESEAWWPRVWWLITLAVLLAIFAFFVALLLVMSSPGLVRKLLLAAGYWRIVDPLDTGAIREIAGTLADNFTQEEILLCERLTTLRLEQQARTEGRLEVSAGLLGIFAALVAILFSGGISTGPGGEITIPQVSALVLLGLFLMVLWLFVELRISQGENTQFLTAVVQAAAIAQQLGNSVAEGQASTIRDFRVDSATAVTISLPQRLLESWAVVREYAEDFWDEFRKYMGNFWDEIRPQIEADWKALRAKLRL